IVYGYDGLPIQPLALSSPDYVPGPEHLPSPDYVPDPEHPPTPVEIPYADYPADGGDGDDDDDDDDTDSNTDEDLEEEPFKEEEDDEKEEEHLAPADPSVVPIVDPILQAGDTETRLRRARKTVRLEPSLSASMEACIARHATLLSPPLPVPSPPLPLPSPLTTSPTDTGGAPLGYREAKIRMRALLPSTS
nr:hypothetical protein [Tanacetum cinerariifolium]